MYAIQNLRELEPELGSLDELDPVRIDEYKHHQGTDQVDELNNALSDEKRSGLKGTMKVGIRILWRGDFGFI